MKLHHILLVEDDLDDIELFREVMEDSGISNEVSVITVGDEVLPYLENCGLLPDVIVLDLNMPKTSGKEILALLKASGKLKHIPVVILTTSNAKIDYDECLKGGAEMFITKPVDSSGFKIMAGDIFKVLQR